MIINGWDISDMTIPGWEIPHIEVARQWNVRRGYSAITNKSEWVAGSKIPVILSGEPGFKPLKIVILVKARDREAVQLGISTILSKLLEPAEIILDGMDRMFRGYLKSYSVDESTHRRNFPFHQLTLNMEGYEYSDRQELSVAGESASGARTINIHNPGTLPSPAVLTITPKYAVSSVTIGGTGEDIVLSSLSYNVPVVVNGETGLITSGGSLADFSIWSLPAVAAGDSSVTVSSKYVSVGISFEPRYM